MDMCNLESLADKLFDEIKKNKNPFDTYTVIVPNLLNEQWLKSYWLRKFDNVLMNVKFKRLVPFINEVFFPDKKFISSDIMGLSIYDIISKNKVEFPELANYEGLRLYSLAKKLAKIFIDYDKNSFKPDGWQSKLFDMIKAQNSQYAYFSDLANKEVEYKAKVFAIGFLRFDATIDKVLDKIHCIKLIQDNQAIIKKPLASKAPSREREIELLHGNICKLLASNPKLKLYDILVYAPKLQEYEPAIKKVFYSGNDSIFPEIPYIISKSASESSKCYEALRLLNEIISSKSFNRRQFIDLISNSVVQKTRGIDNRELSIIIEAINNLNIYRNTTPDDEWIYGIRRILLAKLISLDDTFKLNNNEYLAYSDLSLTNEIASKLIAAISDLEQMLNDLVNNPNMDSLVKYLDLWLSNKKDGFEQNYFYNEALKELNIAKENNYDITLNVLLESMLDKCKSLSLVDANAINGGVTFIEFDEKNILASKYMFFLGMSSNNLPRSDTTDILDQNNPKDISLDQLDQNIFNNLYHNASEVFCSYVNIDLKTMEDFANSSLVDDSSLKLNLVESRPYSKLYSKTEFRKKEYALNLVSTKASQDKVLRGPSIKADEIKYRSLVSFLKNPFKAKFDFLFNDYDDTSDEAKKSFEPFELDSLTSFSLMRDIMIELFLPTPNLDHIFKEYKLRHKLPYLDFKAEFDTMCNNVQNYKNAISAGRLEDSFSLILDDWVLSVNDKFIVSEEEASISFYSLNKYDKPKIKNYLAIYIISLAYIIKNNINNARIYLHVSEIEKKEYDISITEAKDILKQMYQEYFNFKDTIMFKIEKMEDAEYASALADSYSSYSDTMKMVDVKESAGFTRDNFDQKWQAYKDLVLKWVRYR